MEAIRQASQETEQESQPASEDKPKLAPVRQSTTSWRWVSRSWFLTISHWLYSSACSAAAEPVSLPLPLPASSSFPPSLSDREPGHSLPVSAQPNFELGYALKFMRLMLLVLTAWLNLWGFIIGCILILCFLIFNKTLSGRSYLNVKLN